jgi:hypothetical protein
MNESHTSKPSPIARRELSSLERGVSLVTGGLLAATIPRMRLRDVALGAAAAYALYRGITGRCPLRQWTMARISGRRDDLACGKGAAELAALLRPVDHGQHGEAMKRTSAEDMVVDEASRESIYRSPQRRFGSSLRVALRQCRSGSLAAPHTHRIAGRLPGHANASHRVPACILTLASQRAQR